MSRKSRIVLLAICIIGAGAVVKSVFVKRPTQPLDVQTDTVSRQDVVATISASGQVQARTRVNLSSEVAGRIVSLNVQEGDYVTKGQVLLRIDSAQFRAAYERAQASLASTNAQAAQTQENTRQVIRSLERAEELIRISPGAVTGEQMETLRAQARIATIQADASQHSVKQAEAAVRDARSNVEKTVILAPMSGRVTRLSVREGETAVVGNLSRDAAALMTISDMSVLETRIRVDETEVTRISSGDSADVEIDAFPDTSFHGVVVSVSNSSTRPPGANTSTTQAVDFEVTIRLIDAPSQTRPDFSATAKVITEVRKSAIAIPIGALTIRDNPQPPTTEPAANGESPGAARNAKRDQEGVFVVGADGKAVFRPVSIGITGETHFEVLDGLKEGDVIVAGPFQAIRDMKDSALVRARPGSGIPR
jgi:HlyD family secretion protein